MTLKNKIFLIIFLTFILIVFYAFFVIEFQVSYDNHPLQNKTEINLFKNISNYINLTNNAIITENVISTGMYTDANYQNYYVIIKIPANNYYVKQAWEKGQAFVSFESFLESTNEWIVNNKYVITMYYYDNKCNHQVTFFEEEWVGRNNIVSNKVPLPIEAKNKPIYIKYKSHLGKFMFLPNGNDVRFKKNYLTIQ